ncbi:MAG: GTPase ObgE [Oscillospiraceae bacterium]|jgi:GTP-binding protein|nr:GTPase ObgE [Oscillospiraceae bacterium]
MFIDKAKITVSSGKGGDGAVSFRREKYVAAGGPDGGDGGRGGGVYLAVDKNMSTLINFKYRRNYAAPDGSPGMGRRCSGKSGGDLIIGVPRGTLVRDAGSGRLIADMSSQSEPVLIAKGGNGGWGNSHFASPTRQIPRFAKPGNPGEKLELLLELKLLADVGLVGFPNVGKSTLISVVSNAKPEIANYHFTTLSPVLGVVRVSDEFSYVMADIPGLIEGASEGLGLGREFLRHVERCRMILHIVDVSGSEGRDPIEDFEKINFELKKFNPELAGRLQIVVGNKGDLADWRNVEALRDYAENLGYIFFEISAVTQKGVQDLKNEIARILPALPPIAEYEPDAPELPEASAGREFSIEKHGDVYLVDAPWLLRVMNSCNMDDYESLQYFQRVLVNSGIIADLEEKGVQEGDLVSIYDFEFNYVP